MEISAEIRWFWPEACPAGLEAWFERGGSSPGGGATRTDVYLRDPGQTELGVKQRGHEPGLELKGLIGRQEPGIDAGPLEGPIELWGKWTTAALDLAGRPTVALAKRRRLRLFDTERVEVREIPLGPDGRPLAGAALPEQGCRVELTRIVIEDGGAVWWTLGFEAFGGLGTVEDSVRWTALALTVPRPPTLAGGRLLSYPAWLAEL